MSTGDKKRLSFSNEHSMKEHHDDNNNREIKNIDTIPIEEVLKEHK